MRKALIHSALFLTLPFLSACTKQELPSRLVFEVPADQEVAVAPCSFNDSVYLEGLPSISGKIQYYSIISWDNIESLGMNFSGTWARLVIRSKYDGGFKNMKSARFDFANTGNKKIELFVDDGGVYYNLNPISGEMYFIRQPDGNMKIDWCEIVYSLTNPSNRLLTKGGVLIKY